MKLKSDLREELLKRREALSLERKREGSAAIVRELVQKLSSYSMVLSFASQFGEVDLWPLNEQLANEGRLALNKTNLDGDLAPYLVSDFNKQLKKRQDWNLLEPIPEKCERITTDKISVVLVPGLGFMLDSGHRLGHGQGYYDCFLKDLDCPKWGVCFKEQVIQEPFEPELHDVPVDEITLG